MMPSSPSSLLEVLMSACSSPISLSNIRASLSASALPRPRAARSAQIAVDLPRLAAFLRDRHPVDTAKRVAADAGVPSRTVANWLVSDAAPTFQHTMRLVAAYGPALIVACVTPVPGWAGEAARAERKRAIEAELARLAGELAEVGGV
ncbi:hypothetical protein MKI84_12980 [Ancylobacter sp. A5.8]|uniref:hypothetical protein n=1 Tax=Ancylobacter gelatini TaxID=2919920 RepID=UPI001F4DDCD2|nr:hypothetical protein [Ancylobacter gelatini]MCJ8143831.1 hypothetical protein [Ancylobacter gelatini]